MNIPSIQVEDLSRLAEYLPDLDFSDEERRSVLLENGSRDIQAAPGSGKTTILAAKLLLMAEKWPYTKAGICVLSHTNVARDEIIKRLTITAAGSKLLSYPHYVGTIHSFVNHFLALPLLRSWGKTVDVIDNDVFAAKAFALLPTQAILNAWVKRNEHNGPQAISTLSYQGKELTVGWEQGRLPDADTPSGKQAITLKRILSERGIFRHEDMFAFAEHLLYRCPGFPTRLSKRFPFVLIDEMQDTDWRQENLLHQVFDSTTVIQRYGDRNQRILNSSKDAKKLTFPKDDCLSISTTKRFPENIAALVRSVQEHGKPIAVSSNSLEGVSPTLILYDEREITSVIPAFGKYVLNTLPDTAIEAGTIKAICARKQGAWEDKGGGHLGEYWPVYSAHIANAKSKECVFSLLNEESSSNKGLIDLRQKIKNINRAILLILRDAKCEVSRNVRDGSMLARRLESTGIDPSDLLSLRHQLVLNTKSYAESSHWDGTIDLIYEKLKSLLPAETCREDFRSLPVFFGNTVKAQSGAPHNEIIARQDNRSLCIQLGTIASVKGETHAATLVLEAFDGRAQCFDLSFALASLEKGMVTSSKLSDSKLKLLRNLYVAMSRPQHLLCLAMNKNRADMKLVEALASKGWKVITLEGQNL